MLKDSLQPFGAQLRALRQEKGKSLEDLAFATREHGGKLTFSYVGQVERGTQYPTPATIALLAKALGVAPEEFIAYRLARARRLFDEREVGLEEAARNLAALEAAVGDELEQLLAEAAPGGKARRRGARGSR